MDNPDFFLLDPGNEPFAAGRSARLPAGGHSCILLFMSLFVLAGLLVTADVARRWVHFALLHTGYAESPGQVVDRRIESDEGATYYVTYRFAAAGGEYTVEEIVDKATYYAVEDRQSLTVRYARRDPTIATIEPGRVGSLLALTAFCLLWDGFVLAFTRPLVRQVLRRRRLARDGLPIRGEVVRGSTRRDGDGDLVLDLEFRFRSPLTGSWIEGHDSQLRKDLEGRPPPPGTPVHLLYLDDEAYLLL